MAALARDEAAMLEQAAAGLDALKAALTRAHDVRELRVAAVADERLHRQRAEHLHNGARSEVRILQHLRRSSVVLLIPVASELHRMTRDAVQDSPIKAIERADTCRVTQQHLDRREQCALSQIAQLERQQRTELQAAQHLGEHRRWLHDERNAGARAQQAEMVSCSADKTATVRSGAAFDAIAFCTVTECAQLDAGLVCAS